MFVNVNKIITSGLKQTALVSLVLFYRWQDRNLEVALHMAIEFCPVLHSAQL